MAGAPLIATDLKTTLSSSINDDDCGDRSVNRCDPDNYLITSSLSHSKMSKVGQIHGGRGGCNSCTAADGICRDPDQAIHPKEGLVKPEIMESRRDRTNQGRHSDSPSSRQHSPRPCHTSSPRRGTDVSEHSGQNF